MLDDFADDAPTNTMDSVLVAESKGQMDKTFIDATSPLSTDHTPQTISSFTGVSSGVSTTREPSLPTCFEPSSSSAFPPLLNHPPSSNASIMSLPPMAPVSSKQSADIPLGMKFAPFPFHDDFSMFPQQHPLNYKVNPIPVHYPVDPMSLPHDYPTYTFDYRPLDMELPGANHLNSDKTVVQTVVTVPVKSEPEEEEETSEDKDAKKKNVNHYSEEILDDGFQWRKYGQKFSKHSPYPTCYYKCAYPNCNVKRQLQRDADGTKVTSIYRGKHNHSAPKIVKISVETQENFVEVVNLHTSEEAIHTLPSIITASPCIDPAVARATAPTAERRLIVEITNTKIDAFSDGFTWKKYGQKQVKGDSSLMRSYFKCAVPNCNAKKLVQKSTSESSSDENCPTVVTYEHLHCHSIFDKKQQVVGTMPRYTANPLMPPSSGTLIGHRTSSMEHQPQWKKPKSDPFMQQFPMQPMMFDMSMMTPGTPSPYPNQQFCYMVQAPNGTKMMVPHFPAPMLVPYYPQPTPQKEYSSINDGISLEDSQSIEFQGL
ncbi:hypothetical protein RCL1_004150 [Eukaryota sp. TZLM3-RCL]